MDVTFTGATSTDERQFRCGGCDYEADVTVTAAGEGAQSFLNAPGTAERRAKADAVRSLDRAMNLATCPKCGYRDPRAARNWWLVQLIPFVLLIAGIAFLGWIPMLFDMNMREADKPIAGWVVTGIAAVVALPYLFTIYMKWQGATHGVTFPDQDTKSGKST